MKLDRVLADRELAAALVRRRPPDGFADRVLARVRAERRSRFRRWRAGALAAAVVVAVLGATALDRIVDRRRMAEAEAARDQLLLALSITSDKLSAVTRTLNAVEPPAPPAAEAGGTR